MNENTYKEDKVIDAAKKLTQIIEKKEKALNSTEEYQELLKERKNIEKKNGEYLFQNISLGEERGKAESEIKLLEAKINALRATEIYLDTLLEETQKNLTQVDVKLRELERSAEVKKYLKESK